MKFGTEKGEKVLFLYENSYFWAIVYNTHHQQKGGNQSPRLKFLNPTF